MHKTTDDAMTSRSTGLPAQWGKATAILSAKVPDRVKVDAAAFAHSIGMTESDWLRDLIMAALYGQEMLVSMRANQLRLVSGKGYVPTPEAQK